MKQLYGKRGEEKIPSYNQFKQLDLKNLYPGCIFTEADVVFRRKVNGVNQIFFELLGRGYYISCRKDIPSVKSITVQTCRSGLKRFNFIVDYESGDLNNRHLNEFTDISVTDKSFKPKHIIMGNEFHNEMLMCNLGFKSSEIYNKIINELGYGIGEYPLDGVLKNQVADLVGLDYVLDYKTGREYSAHKDQLKGYCDILGKDKGYIYYKDQDKLARLI